MIPSGHRVFLVQNPKDVELLLMHNRTYAAEYGDNHEFPPDDIYLHTNEMLFLQDRPRRLLL
jgi:hypothetical protein